MLVYALFTSLFPIKGTSNKNSYGSEPPVVWTEQHSWLLLRALATSLLLCVWQMKPCHQLNEVARRLKLQLNSNDISSLIQHNHTQTAVASCPKFTWGS